MTNKEIIDRAIAEIIARGNNPYYPVKQHAKDMDLIADLAELKRKYRDEVYK
jgi:hypothetical protein